jgi:23S rRNA (pseudouridine1915-N3)-methyltransferase
MPRPIGQITLIAVGKLKMKPWQLAQAEYSQRLGFYTRLNLVELKDMVGSLPDNVALAKEGELLINAAASIPVRIALTPAGQPLTSPQLADFLQKQIERYNHLAFLIGGPLGFSPEALATCPQQISLSPLTFTHEMARVILLEQLYRAFTILNGERYHK